MPRAGLSAQSIIEVAARILDDQAGEPLNLGELAHRLGVKPPSLYKHVAGMPGLRRGIMLRAKADLASALGQAAIGKAREDAVRGTAVAYRRWAKAHPGQYPLTIRPPVAGDSEDEAVSSALVNVLYTIVSGYRIDGDDNLVDAARYLRSALHGFVDLETTDAFQLPRDLESSFARVIDSIANSLVSWGGSPS